ncbi:transmembrane protein 150C isoform X1 [Fundulus heteroclitus]|uniref:transmembrane protein 150C isoform X1 n=2 Tax=Fundulus heteroclitus TaxID=8078 RepID=UPI00165BA272|nr:transmembrane protein 150C isoform X1 [Fundulus heteroclitus]
MTLVSQQVRSTKMRSCNPWVFLPPIFSVCTAAGLWGVYFVALYDNRVLPLSSTYRRRNGTANSPYISMAGNFPPASCIFSQVMNLAAFAGFVVGILRYLQVKNRLDKPWLNNLSLVLFSISCLAMTAVGNFQVLEMKGIHDVATWMTFLPGLVYFLIQSYITLKVNLRNEGRVVAICRFLLSAAIILCIILKQSLGSLPYMHNVRCQWALVMLYLIFLSTFAIEFRHCRFEVVCRDAVEDQSEPGASPGCREQLKQL